MMTSSYSKGIDRALQNFDYGREAPLPDDVPLEPEEFYRSFGYLTHPLTKKPVKELAPYQLAVWHALYRYKRVLAIKSQKIGLTTSVLLTDFHQAILPSSHPFSCRGFDILVIGQTKDHAKEHLRTLRKMVNDSKKYRAWLIDKPLDLDEEDSFRRVIKDEATKSAVLFIRNPENERQPTRIIALGLENEGALMSWKSVKAIHISDASAAQGDITAAVNYAISRLALTMGSLCIETPPSPPSGPIFGLWQKSAGIAEPKEGQFKVFEIPAADAVAAGIMAQGWLDSERERDPVNFPRLYGAKFDAMFGNIFAAQDIERAIEIGRQYDPDAVNVRTVKSLGIDPAFGSSKFAFVLTQLRNGKIEVLLADEYERPDFNQMVNRAWELVMKYNVTKVYVDSANPEVIAGLKRVLGERADYEEQIAMLKKRHAKPIHWMRVLPVAFGSENSQMLGHSKMLIEKGLIAVNPKFDKLLSAMRSAIEENGHLDKASTLHDDIFDSFRLSLKYYNLKGGGAAP